MLFKNLVSGNIVSVTNKTVVEQMQKSPNYEPVVITPAPTEEPEISEPEGVEPEETALAEEAAPAEEAKAVKGGKGKKAAE